MRRTIDLDQVRVYQADNSKGNPWVVIEILDEPVLYISAHDLSADENLGHYVTWDNYGQPEVDTDTLADFVRWALARHYAKILQDEPHSSFKIFTTNPDRGVRTDKPRLVEDPYED